jgi:hypothetical protein
MAEADSETNSINTNYTLLASKNTASTSKTPITTNLPISNHTNPKLEISTFQKASLQSPKHDKCKPPIISHLKKLGDAFYPSDIDSWLSIVESSRHIKQTLISKNIKNWSSWYDQILEFNDKTDISSLTTLLPLPACSVSNTYRDCETTDSEGNYRRQRRNISISTGPSSPTPRYISSLRQSSQHHSDSSDSGSMFTYPRSQSEGDLFAYVKGFLELKHVLIRAQKTMIEELMFILNESDLSHKFKANSKLFSSNEQLKSTNMIKGSLLLKHEENDIQRLHSSHVLTTEDTHNVNNSEQSPPSLRLSGISIDLSEGSNDWLNSEIGNLKSICQEIIDSELNQLMNPNVCKSFINRLQSLQRDWHVKSKVSPLSVLVIFAGVSRLVDHIEDDTWMWSYDFINNL